ncbi:MAG: hypothetical protein IT378_16295, partial [Sandaracinaceae bacterium]|nr:hypothetical protein [Sandaracinaceae bacterium]
MGWLERWWSKRGARARVREEAIASARGLLDEGRVREAFAAIERVLMDDPEAQELMHLAATILRRDAQPETAELFDRAADAPGDTQLLLQLGSDLLSRDAPALAATFLERALAFAPFDAVIRSELALAYARQGRPDRVVETLALHPCLADDPGALFEFAWASLLTGDLESAEGAARALAMTPQTRDLRRKLENTLARARLGTAGAPDARDFLFIEHGALLLDAAGPYGGRYDALELDDARIVGLAARAAWAVRELVPLPHRVVAL